MVNWVGLEAAHGCAYVALQSPLGRSPRAVGSIPILACDAGIADAILTLRERHNTAFVGRFIRVFVLRVQIPFSKEFPIGGTHSREGLRPPHTTRTRLTDQRLPVSQHCQQQQGQQGLQQEHGSQAGDDLQTDGQRPAPGFYPVPPRRVTDKGAERGGGKSDD